MEYLVTAHEMKRCDKNTIEKYGLPSEVLMERAALGVVEEIVNSGWNVKKALVVCGSGNNGGDGFAIARLLFLQGVVVKVIFAGKEERLTKECRMQRQIALNYGIPVLTGFSDEEADDEVFEDADIVVDALFGVGLSRNVEGVFEKIIERINMLGSRGAKIVAADIPSGINSDTGEVMNAGVKADLTVSFAFRKLGSVFYPGAAFCGRLVVRDIGITKEAFLGEMPEAFTYTKKDTDRFPKRRADGNKSTFGKVLVIAGSEGMSGAAYLCAKAVFRTGAGMVRIYTWEGNREILQTLLPEGMVTTYRAGETEHTELEKCLSWADTICMGPGIGQDKTARALLKKVFQINEEKPLVLDADALNLIAENARNMRESCSCPIVITPHPGEMARLTGRKIEYIKEHMAEMARAYAKENKLVCVLKDARTVVSGGNDRYYVNLTGNSGMATAGSGDVLSGVISGLISQGMDLEEAACLGVFLHGEAGDRAASVLGEPAVMAGDIINYLGNEG